MENKFTVDYFIEKFSKIPDKNWCTQYLLSSLGKSCALGHCGVRSNNIIAFGGIEHEEGSALAKILAPVSMQDAEYSVVYEINDGHNYNYKQPTPKQRILAALYDIKKMQDGQATSPEEKPKPKPQPEKIRYVSVLVDKPIVEQAKELISN
jgi:hypothetical protein